MAQRKELVDGTGIELYNQAKWSRSTVADGKWLQSDTLDPISANDRILASAIHDVSADFDEMINYVSATVDANKIELHNEIYVASSYLQGEVDMLEAATDVVDIIGTLPDLSTYSERITENDIIKILDTEGTWTDPVTQTEHVFSGDQVYLRYTGETTATPDPTKWTYVGQIKPPNSWKQWSEENDTKVNGTNNYYIGSGNSAFGNTVVFGNNNESKSTDKLIKEANTKVYNTQNFIVGNDNSANTTRNAFVFGSKNYSETTQSDLELDSTSQNNDGFTLAFGLENSAIRNYDIAIGREVLASGGENIVIGVPGVYSCPTKTSVYYDTRSVGYQNLNIRSHVDGHNNIAFMSYVHGFDFEHGHNETGLGLNRLYYSVISGVNKNPGQRYIFDANIAHDTYMIMDYSNHAKSIPVVGNLFNHTNNFSYKAAPGTDSSCGFISNEFFDVENMSAYGDGEFNRNKFKHIGQYKLTLVGVCYDNDFEHVAVTNTVDLSADYISNNIIRHNNSSITMSALNIDMNEFKHIQYAGAQSNLYANYIHGNYAYCTDFPTTLSAEDGNIDYNFMFNIENYNGGSMILPRHGITGGMFSKNILFNIYQPKIDGYNVIDSNIIHNTKISAVNVTNKNWGFIENIILNNNGPERSINFDNITTVLNNVILESKVSGYINETSPTTATVNSNIILYSNINHEFYNEAYNRTNYSLTHNFVFNSKLKSNYSERPDISCFRYNSTQNNVLFNYDATNVYGSFAFCDGEDGGDTTHANPALLRNCNSVLSLGQSHLENAVECGSFGHYSKIVNSDRSYTFGQFNNIVGGKLGSTSPVCNENISIGINNIMSANSADDDSDQFSRNFIFGKNNKLTVRFGNGGGTDDICCDNYMIGFANAFGNIQSNYNRYDAQQGMENNALAAPVSSVQRSFLVGSYNVLTNHVHDSFIFGTRNAIKTENDSIVENNYIIGTNCLGVNGSNQFSVGMGNYTKGYYAMGIGEALIANDSQLVIGRLNEELPGTNGISADNIDSTSGALFVIGNGRHKLITSYKDNVDKPKSYKEENIERSNAMLVSANGAVSSKYVLASDGFSGVNISGSTKTATIDSLIGSNNTIMGSLYEYSNPDPTVRTISTLGIYQQYNHRKSYQIVCTAEDTTTASYGYLMSTTEENLTDAITASALHFAESAASGIIEYRSISPQSQGNFTLTSGLYVKKDTTQGKHEIVFGYYDSSNTAHDVAELVPDNHNRDQYLTTDATNRVVWSNKPDVLNGIAVKIVATSGDATASNVLYIVTGA